MTSGSSTLTSILAWDLQKCVSFLLHRVHSSQLKLMQTLKPKENHSHFWWPAYIPSVLSVLRIVLYNCTNPRVQEVRLSDKICVAS